METRHPIEGSLVVNFRRSVIIAELWRHEVAIRASKLWETFLRFFWKNDPLRFCRFDAIPMDRQTDGQTDTGPQHIPQWQTVARAKTVSEGHSRSTHRMWRYILDRRHFTP